jgi:hypothetical protein
MSLLEKLGFRISKPEIKYKLPPEISKASQKVNKDRKALYEKDAQETALLYSGWIGKETFDKVVALHDYRCVIWGSRKFARLTNLSRNILDVDIFKDDPVLFEKDRNSVTKILMWMSLLFPVPIKRYHLGHGAEEECKKEILTLLEGTDLLEAEVSLVIEGVFLGVSTVKGNPILDIFHDALKYEEVQFGNPCEPKLMRTELGRNDIFLIKAHRDCSANRCPDWVLYLQEHMDVENFVNKTKAQEDSAYDDLDGISA